VADKFEKLNELDEEIKTHKHCLEILFKREIRGKIYEDWKSQGRQWFSHLQNKGWKAQNDGQVH
jgi:hypothetical protein